MADASELTGPFVGQSGRTYLRVPELSARVDGLLQVVAVVAADDKRSRAGDPQPRQILGLLSPLLTASSAKQALSSELDALERLSKGSAAVPGRRLHERLSGPVSGGIVDWCPIDLEQWWGGVALEAEGYRNLCLAMADICRRVADWSAAARGDMAIGQTPPRVRPRGVLRTVGGRWLLSGFGASVQALLGVEDAGAHTEVMTASSHFQPPEELFLARSEHPMAALTWAVGSTFFALLKMRALL
ncbi:MAG: hypothetical protein GXP62_09500, partial [Oligoflexia bacterium]|nr:hypothetical protein [Oligoflexia bacterium]